MRSSIGLPTGCRRIVQTGLRDSRKSLLQEVREPLVSYVLLCFWCFHALVVVAEEIEFLLRVSMENPASLFRSPSAQLIMLTPSSAGHVSSSAMSRPSVGDLGITLLTLGLRWGCGRALTTRSAGAVVDARSGAALWRHHGVVWTASACAGPAHRVPPLVRLGNGAASRREGLHDAHPSGGRAVVGVFIALTLSFLLLLEIT